MAMLEHYLRSALGDRFEDLRASLPDIVSDVYGAFSPRPIAGITDIACHHTAGPKNQTWSAIRAFHIGPQRNWAGLAYHIGVRNGRVAYVGDVTLARACVSNLNHRCVCVVVTGNYETDILSPADETALRLAVSAIQAWARDSIGRTLGVSGHGELPGQSTQCPGRNLTPTVHALAALYAGGAVSPVTPAPVPPVTAPAPSVTALWTAADAQATLPVTRAFALWQRITAQGYIPISGEFRVGIYTAQRATHPRERRERLYYVPSAGPYDRVVFIERQSAA
mgnify:CR=1 FL=1